MARGWKRCQSVPIDQTGAVSIKWGNSEGNPHNSFSENKRSNDHASSQWSPGDCQDEAFSARFSLISGDRQNGGGSGQRMPAMPSCKP